MFAEGVGEDFEVLEVLVLGCRIELDPGHGEIEEDAVVDLAERSAVEDAIVSWSLEEYEKRRPNSPSAALLDLGHVELQQAVKPCQQFLSVFAPSVLVCSP